MQGLGETTAMLARLRRSMPSGQHTDETSGGGLVETERFGENPGELRMLSYAPPSLPPGAPLVVVLHGCTQNGQGYARDAGWVALADRFGFAVLAPEQRAANNPNRCFNWFEPGDTRRGQGEAASIAAMIATTLAVHKGDPRQVFVTGLSAGGAMSAVMLAVYPELFAGGAIIAGLPYGVARGIPDALRTMSQGAGCSDAALGAVVGRRTMAPIRLSIWHGDADATVNRVNAQDLAAQWTAVVGLDRGSAEVERLDNGRTRSVWQAEAEGSVIELNIVHGLGHGAPLGTKGPDGVGRPAPYMLEVGISSTMEIARFWELDGRARSATGPGFAEEAEQQDIEAPSTSLQRADDLAAAEQPAGLAAQVLDAVSPHVPRDVSAVIAKALRAAGLMK